MNQATIFIPFFGLMLLTIIVWFYMYYLRISFMVANKIKAQALATNNDVHELMPPEISTPSENLTNLFELPILFYAICIYLYVTNQVDTAYVVLAYSFLGLRVAHSVIHCTNNKVLHRFYSYMLSSVVLWALILRAFVEMI